MAGGERQQKALEEAKRAWPDLDVPEDRFFEALERAAPEGKVADLYLAVGCLAGRRRALEVLERQILPQVRGSVERVCGSDLSADDALQATREKLLIGGPDRIPKLAQYMGEGQLVGWIRVAAVRDALALRRAKNAKRKNLGDDARLLPSTPANAHLALLRQTHAAAFKAAVEEGIKKLSVEQRNLLRMNMLDGLTIDQLAPLFRIHRATAARRLAQARESILEHTRTTLGAKLGLSDTELGSLCNDLASQLHLSLSRVLDAAEGAP